jgi:hypothetical protein
MSGSYKTALRSTCTNYSLGQRSKWDILTTSCPALPLSSYAIALFAVFAIILLPQRHPLNLLAQRPPIIRL